MSRPATAADDFDLLLAAWFESDAHVAEPETLFHGVIGKTSSMRPLAPWRLPERWIPMDLAMRVPRPRTRLAPILFALLLAVILAVGAVIVGSRQETRLPPPFGVAANGQIAFVVDGHLTLADPDGTDLVVVRTDTPRQRAPQFSNDGTKIVYSNATGPVVESELYGPMDVSDIVVADADGSHPVVVANDVLAGNPLWSPDGRWITYTDSERHVFVTPSDGSAAPTDLGDFDGKGAWTPAFSPDSEKLAVSVGEGTLWIVGRDGSDPKQVSRTYPEVGGKGSSASWSPDGTKLLFRAGEPGEHGNLYVVGLDGAPEVQIAADAELGVWSPDGTQIAWIQNGGLGFGPRLVVGSVDPAKGARILEGFYGSYVPAWSPDQTRIAILDDRPGPKNQPGPPVIVIVDPAGVAPPVTIPAGTDASDLDFTLSWQRLARP
jgi:Tol biopolymer transport system component